MQVLIVDDDQVTVEVVRDSVHWEQLNIHRVFTANNAEKARGILRSTDIDVVISDIEMPRESGLELLRWYRAEGFSGKFLLLTCHENFSYASDALRYHADEYLTKPFNVEIMEMTLQKLVRELVREKREKNYQDWMKQNAMEIRRNFLSAVISGRPVYSRDVLRESIRNMDLDLQVDEEYRMIVSHVMKADIEHSEYGHDFIQFLLEQVHGALVCDEFEEGTVVVLEEADCINAAVISREKDVAALTQACTGLIAKVDSLAELTVTVCISDSTTLTDMHTRYSRIREILRTRIGFVGMCFLEKEAGGFRGESGPVLDMKKLDRLMEEHSRKAIMEYVKHEMEMRSRRKMLDRSVLELLQAEVRQSIYTYLSGKGIQISSIMDSDQYRIFSDNAASSVMNMIKWINYMLDVTFTREEELARTEDIVDQINRYVADHYMEDIGRNEIGAHFYLVPEYVSKMYKKKTGISLKDHINEVRIRRAKQLLLDPGRSVGEIAAEVGFGNLSYFSTVFKKAAGMTPIEYRKKNDTTGRL